MHLCRMPFADLARQIHDAESWGFDSAWVDDDLFTPRYSDFDPWTVLAALAVQTERIRLGTLVTVTTFRPPAVLAAQVVTADHIANGRIEIGLGAGGAGLNDTVGLAEWSPRERAERLDEYAAILAPMLRGERVDFDGLHYSVHNAQAAPPVRPPGPPLIVAAHGERGLRTAARHAGGWNALIELAGSSEDATASAALADAVARTKGLSDRLDAICAEEGRDASTLRRSVLLYPGKVDPLSSVDAFDQVTGAFQEIGIDEFVINWPPIKNLMPAAGEGEAGVARRPPDIPLTAAQRSAFERIVAERIVNR
jgi:alkanesulfonate monooxygenase SsuD/methylene tetrahydromethanopterin reductase-like flavin-dependent oxidoreductase (luciferase family)